MNKAVLFLIFNRKDSTQKVFEKIKIAQPPKLYIASDGPRLNKEGETQIVDELRKWVLSNIDWDCEVKTLFREKNLGCGHAVSNAITWFFDQEQDGIILEDDCLPSQSFFKYCEELLEFYKDDKRIWHIGGFNPLNIIDRHESYYFSKVQEVWGWASWADRWQKYKFDLNNFDSEHLKRFSDKKEVQKYWSEILKQMKNKEIDTWDYQWVFSIIENNGVCINPTKNLISNIGFEGTHYEYNIGDSTLNTKTYEIEEIIHPEKIEFDDEIVDLIYKKSFGIEHPIKQIFNYIKCRPLFLFRKSFWKLVKELY